MKKNLVSLEVFYIYCFFIRYSIFQLLYGNLLSKENYLNIREKFTKKEAINYF